MERKIRCSTPGCSGQSFKEFENEIFCNRCRRVTCISCNANHENKTCEYYRRLKEKRSRNVPTARERNPVHVSRSCKTDGCNSTVLLKGLEEGRLLCAQCCAYTCMVCDVVHGEETCEEFQHRKQSPVSTAHKKNSEDLRNWWDNLMPEEKNENEENNYTLICCSCRLVKPIDSPEHFPVCPKCNSEALQLVIEAVDRKSNQLLKSRLVKKQTVKESKRDERKEFECKNEACGAIIFAEASSRFALCSQCNTVTCFRCNEAHEGRPCKTKTAETSHEPLQSKRKSLNNVLQEVTCKNSTCSATNYVKTGSRFLECDVCHTLTCLKCNEAHEGKPCRTNTVTTKDCEIDKIEEVKCQKVGCGAVNFIKTGSKLFPCSQCRTVTCLRCKEAHEGRSCKSKTAVNQTKPSENAEQPPKGSNLQKPWVQGAKLPGKAVPLPSADSVGDSTQEEEPMDHSWMEANPTQGNAEELLEAVCPHCHAILFTKREQHTVSCEYCQRQFCSECRVNHEGKSCDDYMNKLQREAALQGVRQNGASVFLLLLLRNCHPFPA